jgi:hypothetical protein
MSNRIDFSFYFDIGFFNDAILKLDNAIDQDVRLGFLAIRHFGNVRWAI